jgi:hypothetical protein
MRERENNFSMNYEDNGNFGGSAMEQNNELANIVNPPVGNPAIEALKKQILGQGLTGKWSGQGRGSAEANAEDMAKILAGIGITDIKQFGLVDRDVERIVGAGPDDVPIYETVTEKTFGNKLTGQAVPNTYSERQKGDFFGGTFEGKGNTGYGVKFDDQGNPLFYTQGASSSDIGNIAPLLTMASFVPGLQPFAMAANAAIAAKQGNPLGVITNLAGMGGLAGVSGMADVAKAARFASAVQSGDPLAMAFSGANLGGVTNIGGIDLKDVSKTIGGIKAIQSGDPLAMMLYGIDVMPKPGGATPTSSAQKDFFDSEKARLTSAGYTSDQIKDYFRNLENLTEDLDFQPEIPPVDSTPPSPTRSLGNDPVKALEDAGLNYLPTDDDFVPTIRDPNELEIVGDREPKYLPTDDDFMPTPIRDEGNLEIVAGREPKYLATDDDFPATPIRDEGEMEIVGKRPTGETPVTTPTTPGATPTPKAPTAPGKTPTISAPATAAKPTAQRSAVQEMVPALLGMPQLGNVFYYGKDFSSQKQQLDPSGRLIQEEYDPLSVTQAGAELELDKIAGSNENDVQALIQQIMANSGGDISPEELAQILGQQGAPYG